MIELAEAPTPAPEVAVEAPAGARTVSENTPSSREKAARLVLLLASTWVAAGALFKLFAGSPNDLPPMVRDFVLGPVQTFRSAISIELCIVILAILRPRFAWLPLAALFAVFVTVLVPLATSGADSCGCFGSSVSIPPIVMLSLRTSCSLSSGSHPAACRTASLFVRSLFVRSAT